MNTSIINSKKHNLANAIAEFSCLAYIVWLFTPALFYRLGTIFPLAMVVICALAMFVDRDFPKSAFRDAMLRWALSLIFALLVWWTTRSHDSGFVRYLGISLLVWFPIPYSVYLRERGNARFYRRMSWVLAITILTTGLFTIIGQNLFPLSSRYLAGSATPEEFILHRNFNIGSFGFIYAIAMLVPLLFALIRFTRRPHLRFLPALAIVGIGIVLISANFLISVFIWFVAVVSFLGQLIFAKTAQKLSPKYSTWLSLALGTLLALSITLLFFGPLNRANSRLYVMINSIIENSEFSINAENTDSIAFFKKYYVERRAGRIIEGEKAIVTTRMAVYLSPILSFPKSPLTGNLISWKMNPGNHSELLDLLLCGGIVGAVLNTILLYLIFRGLFKGKIPHELKPYTTFLLCMVLGHSALNPISNTREIMLLSIFTTFAVADYVRRNSSLPS